jgi:hypothetical protein
MTVEYLGEKVFFLVVEATRKVWVARGIYGNIYALELENREFSLPVWSTREKVVEFLKNAHLVGPKYEPHEIPLDVFTNAWLEGKMIVISEVQIDPDGKTTRVLVLTAEEFKARQPPA